MSYTIIANYCKNLAVQLFYQCFYKIINAFSCTLLLSHFLIWLDECPAKRNLIILSATLLYCITVYLSCWHCTVFLLFLMSATKKDIPFNILYATADIWLLDNNKNQTKPYFTNHIPYTTVQHSTKWTP